MSLEQAMILRARPHMLASSLGTMLEKEVVKGSLPDLAPRPVALEPPFQLMVASGTRDLEVEQVQFMETAIPDTNELIRLKVWISPDEKFDWNRSELFVKQLSALHHPVAYEIQGNSERVEVTILCWKTDLPIAAVAFKGQHASCEISTVGMSLLGELDAEAWRCLQFYDYYPSPPYSHLLTCSDELMTTPFETFLAALATIEPPAVGFYQCVFQGVNPDNNWHLNTMVLLDLEFSLKLQNSAFVSQRYPQQAPSGAIHQMAQDVETKAHNDKPFFCAAVRAGVVGASPDRSTDLDALDTFMALFQHGGRPLNRLSHHEYKNQLPGIACRETFLKGLTYRPGFLVNSCELTGLVHVLPASVIEERSIPLETLETLPVHTQSLQTGTRIGTCRYAGVEQPVCIPPEVRERSTHIISNAGMGKTTVMKHMFLQDINEGKGALFIDPHGDAAREILHLVPKCHHSRFIYFRPSDPEWIPLWNPLYLPPGGDLYRLANDILSTFKHVFTDWGDRLGHVIQNGLIGLGYLHSTCLQDLHDLTRQKTPESDELRLRIIEAAENGPVRKFWEHDFLHYYRPAELQSSRHKIFQLLSGGTTKLMLSQPESKINLRQIIDDQQILLVDLSGLGAEVRNILGALMLRLILVAAMSRSDTEIEKRNSFAVYADEAHLFVGAGAIEDMITQARKFRVNLCIRPQERMSSSRNLAFPVFGLLRRRSRGDEGVECLWQLN